MVTLNYAIFQNIVVNYRISYVWCSSWWILSIYKSISLSILIYFIQCQRVFSRIIIISLQTLLMAINTYHNLILAPKSWITIFIILKHIFKFKLISIASAGYHLICDHRIGLDSNGPHIITSLVPWLRFQWLWLSFLCWPLRSIHNLKLIDVHMLSNLLSFQRVGCIPIVNFWQLHLVFLKIIIALVQQHLPVAIILLKWIINSSMIACCQNIIIAIFLDHAIASLDLEHGSRC